MAVPGPNEPGGADPTVCWIVGPQQFTEFRTISCMATDAAIPHSPTPKAVYDDPAFHIAFLLTFEAEDLEGQEFDRKQAGRIGAPPEEQKRRVAGLSDKVTETVCAFTNGSQRGGLLVLGITDAGRLEGVDHLTEDSVNALQAIGTKLRHHCARSRLVTVADAQGVRRSIVLVFGDYNPSLICETVDKVPRFWMRSGRWNLPGDDSLRESLKREKRIVDFETASCCPFNAGDVDADVMAEYQQQALAGVSKQLSTEEVLRSLGAVDGVTGQRYFTHAGYIFFATSPERVLGARYIRLLRFEGSIKDRATRGTATLDRQFTGPVAQQIRRIRAFLKESGIFKMYQVRRREGGFRDEPEYPPIAIDEAIVNAVGHRDNGVGEPITCEAYRDAFVVRKPGRLRQRSQLVPAQFSLSDIRLETARNNPKLLDWLSRMRDSEGTPYVQLVNEGTNTMREEMSRAGLPPPLYVVTESETRVTFFNDIERREALFRREASAVEVDADEFANLFPLSVTSKEGAPLDEQALLDERGEVLDALRNSLNAHGWHIDRFKQSVVIAHRKRNDLDAPADVRKYMRFYPGYAFRLRGYGRRAYLCVDFDVQVKNVASLAVIRQVLQPDDVLDHWCLFQHQGWHEGRLVRMDEVHATVQMADTEIEHTVPHADVIPLLPVRLMSHVLQQKCPRFDFHKTQRALSLATVQAASRVRAERTLATVQALSEEVFPLRHGTSIIHLHPEPVPLLRKADPRTPLLVVGLQEPKVVFNDRQQTADIRDGITRYGAFAQSPKRVELIPVCLNESRERIEAMIERLKSGKFKYKGAERTFGVRFGYSSIVTVPEIRSIDDECRRLIGEHSEWAANAELSRAFLVESPEAGYSLDDEASPYYSVKRLLLEKVVPCQMIDTPTLANPDWKDLNLALNLAAKCGVRPWVLPNALPDADFFVGLSYTQSVRGPDEKLMRYANVFNSFGHWEFYSANAEAFRFEDRHQHLTDLVRKALGRLSLPDSPHIHFHFTKRFSQEDRAVLLAAARSVRPHGIYSFVSINIGHGVRFYDRCPDSDGSLACGNFVVGGRGQVYVSTTGFNPYRKAMGTPVVLEVNVRTERPDGGHQPVDLRATAVQILCLTKLNWASTDSLCAEPITTKVRGRHRVLHGGISAARWAVPTSSRA